MFLFGHNFLWFIAQLSLGYGLYCLPRTGFYVVMDESTVKDIDSIIDQQDFSEKVFCQVSMKLNVTAKTIDMQFYQQRFNLTDLGTSNLKTSVVSIFELSNQYQNRCQASIMIEAIHICTNRDRCDKEFIQQYARQLTSARFDKFIDHVCPLLFLNETSRFCSIGTDFQTSVCFGVACTWKSDIGSKSIHTSCLSKTTEKLPMITLTKMIEQTDFLSFNNKTTLSLEFACRLNNCNNRVTGETIEKLVFLYYPFWFDSRIEQTSTTTKETSGDLLDKITFLTDITTSTTTAMIDSLSMTTLLFPEIEVTQPLTTTPLKNMNTTFRHFQSISVVLLCFVLRLCVMETNLRLSLDFIS